MQRWHPDKIASGGCAADPARAEEAKARFQQIHEAYQGNVPVQIHHLSLPALFTMPVSGGWRSTHWTLLC
jgi:hypothetical protein